MLDSMLFHHLIEEWSFSMLSHARICKSNKSIEVSSENAYLLSDFTKVEVRQYNLCILVSKAT